MIKFIRLTIAFALIAFAFQYIDINSMLSQAVKSNFLMILFGTLVLALQPIIGALRWEIILSNSKSTVKLSNLIRWSYISVFFGQVLPATFGADGIRIWYASRHSIGLKNAVTSVTLDRVCMLIMLLFLLCFGVSFLKNYIEEKWLGLLVVCIVLTCLFGVIAIIFGDRLPQKLYRFRIFRGIGHITMEAKKLFLNKQLFLFALLLCLLSYINLMASIYLIARGFGAKIQVFDIFVLMPPVLAACALPISIGSWGTREVAMIVALGTANISSDIALLTSLWLGLGCILISLPGGLFFLLDGGSLSDFTE